MKSIYSTIILVIFCISCKSVKEFNATNTNSLDKKEDSKSVLREWYRKDYQKDSVPGISIDVWSNQNMKKAKNKNIYVFVIKSKININHEEMKGKIWVNNNEFPNKGIDDDHNGYVDDINGWSFFGTKSGGYFIWSNFEFVRLIRKYGEFFKSKSESQIDEKDLVLYKEYRRAEIEMDKNNSYYKNWLKSLRYSIALYPKVKDTLKYFFPKEDYTYKQLDSLYKIYKINDKTFRQRREDNDNDLGMLIGFMMTRFDFNEMSLEDVKESESQIDSVVNRNLSFDYNERNFIGDNPEVLEKGYGNNKVSLDRKLQSNKRKFSGIKAAKRENNKGIKGFSRNIKIMPLNISCSGDEHDKDIAMAIRYAVDNGAKVINMSYGKEFSMYQDWVSDAFKYAEKHDVLIVHSAGNNNSNVDEFQYYPSDLKYGIYEEVSSNFINSGSISHKLDSTFVSSFSNYGKKNVDLFAPGDEIYTTEVGNKYGFDSGTSLAGPMVSGTAALIWLYYPKLTVGQVKQIILDSGTAYDLEVIVPGTKDKKVHFSELSKSGKVLNVYNAMKMAEKIN